MKIYLDLLPKERKAELRRKKIFRKILSEEFLFLVPSALLIVILLNVFYILSIKRDMSIAAKTMIESEDEYKELNSYEEKFKQINENSTKLLKIQAGHLYWAEIFKKLSGSMPEGISIADFSTRDYNVFLTGKVDNRDTLLKFKGILEEDACFDEVNVPLSNLVVKEDIDFQMDFLIKKDCLKKK
jgi:hypothetical protein